MVDFGHLDVLSSPEANQVLIQGRESGEFNFDDPADTTNILLGAMLITVLGRAVEGRILDDAGFREPVVDQLVRTATTPA